MDDASPLGNDGPILTPHGLLRMLLVKTLSGGSGGGGGGGGSGSGNGRMGNWDVGRRWMVLEHISDADSAAAVVRGGVRRESLSSVALLRPCMMFVRRSLSCGYGTAVLVQR